LTVLSNAGPIGGGQAVDGPPIVLGNETFQRGVVVRAPSTLWLTLDGRCSSFAAVIGPASDAANGSRVRFAVLADGVLLYRSPAIEPIDGGRVLDLDVREVRRLDLTVESADDAPSGAVAAWADARLRCRS
jgi:endo-alpha-N-acetylgalactosaminidase